MKFSLASFILTCGFVLLDNASVFAAKHPLPIQVPTHVRDGSIYSFHKKTQRCENGRGVIGYNQEGLKPCTDFRVRPLDRLRSGLNLTASNFEGRTIERYQFDTLNLSYANLSHTKLDNSTFNSSVLEGVNFRGSKLYYLEFKNSSLLGAIVDDTTRFKEVTVIQNGNSSRYTDLRDFALSNEMIYISHPEKDESLSLIEGVTFYKVKWDEEKKSGYAFLNFYSHRELLLIQDRSEALRAQEFLPSKSIDHKSQKVTIQVREVMGKKYLLSTEQFVF